MKIEKLKEYVERCVQRSGGNAAEVARKCGIATSTLSQFRSGKYGAKVDQLAKKIAAGLNFYDLEWVLVDSVVSYQQAYTTIMSAKKRSIWLPVSSKAGSGKTQSLIDIYNTSPDNSVVYIKCRKWRARKFLTKLSEAIGLSIDKCRENDQIIDKIVEHFNKIADQRPVLIIDDISKLYDDALLTLIPIYDDTYKRLGAVLSGTETFERRIKKGVGKIDGYDELDGRWGRKYIQLYGATKKNVLDICKANGISSEELRDRIWSEAPKTKIKIPDTDKEVLFVDDLRALGRMIEAELIQAQISEGLIL